AQVQAETFGGKLIRMKNAMGDYFEQIGFVITKSPVFIKMLEDQKIKFEKWGAVVKANRKQLQILAEDIVHGVGIAFNFLTIVINNASRAFDFLASRTQNAHARISHFLVGLKIQTVEGMTKALRTMAVDGRAGSIQFKELSEKVRLLRLEIKEGEAATDAFVGSAALWLEMAKQSQGPTLKWAAAVDQAGESSSKAAGPVKELAGAVQKMSESFESLRKFGSDDFFGPLFKQSGLPDLNIGDPLENARESQKKAAIARLSDLRTEVDLLAMVVAGEKEQAEIAGLLASFKKDFPLLGFGGRDREQLEIILAKRRELNEQLELQNRITGAFENIAGRAFNGFIREIQRGKDALESLVDVGRAAAFDIIAEFGKIALFDPFIKNFINPAASSFAGFLFGGAREHGGPVTPNKAFLVGERGPELFTPGSAGTIIPNNQLAAAGGPVFNVTLNQTIGMGAPAAARIEWMRLRPQIIKDTIAAVAGVASGGGRLSDAIRGR
ncbi:MAG: hypothetical protein IID18_09910, partial [Nitrospinae bacterium]|nr:hypothetical protein [Nitrospinota bacterium]